MHHIQIHILKNKTWTTLPYMVEDEEIDLMIMLWSLARKKGFTATRGDTMEPSQMSSDIATKKDTQLP